MCVKAWDPQLKFMKVNLGNREPKLQYEQYYMNHDCVMLPYCNNSELWPMSMLC